MIALSVGTSFSVCRRVSGALAALTVAALVSGCGQGGRGPTASPTAADGPTPAPPITFDAEQFHYSFVATGSRIRPTGDPANPSNPLPNGYQYLVIEGTLTNASAFPAPRYAPAFKDLGVSVPLDDLVTAGAKFDGARHTCGEIIFFVTFVNAETLPGGRCLLMLDTSRPAHAREANIPKGGRAQATFVHSLPSGVPPNRIRLVGYEPLPRPHITKSFPLPWAP